ncbi:MAG: ChaN family lipoprotein [Pseudomonadota bacterium]
MVVRFLVFAYIFLGVFGTCFCFPDNARSSMQCPSIIVDLHLGEPVSLDVALDDMAGAAVVYVGEYHTISRHHQFQADIMKGLAKRNGISGLAMEMFTTEQQSLVDKWLESKDSVSELLQKLGPGAWNNLKDYESVLLMARDLGIPIISLNAPDSLVRKVSREGLESLPETERKLLPEDIEPVNPDYSRLLSLKLRVHRAFEGKGLTRIIQAQALRDAVMASNIIQFLEKHPKANKPLMVIAGSGHINYGFGIPERVEKYVDASYRIILPSESGELQLSEAEKKQAVEIDISHEDVKFIGRPIADYLSVLPVESNDDETGGHHENVARIQRINSIDPRRHND